MDKLITSILTVCDDELAYTLALAYTSLMSFSIAFILTLAIV